MIALFEVTKSDKNKHLVIVEELVSDEQVQQAFQNLQRDYPCTKLLSVWGDDRVARYIPNEVINERNLLGGDQPCPKTYRAYDRRGRRVRVTIPEE